MAYILKTNYADKSNYGAYRSLSKIKYIVWHYTGNDGDTDEANAKFFKTANRNASAHYFVDDDSITISVPDTYVAWSVGDARWSNYKTTGGASLYKVCTNTNSISIEMCDTLKNGTYDISEKTLENAIELTRELMHKYNIPISNVIRHFDVSGKTCPAYYVDNNKWNAVKQKISSSYIPSYSSNSSSTTSTRSYLMKGDKGAEVKTLQENLNYIGYSCGDVDGDFGTKTDTALRNFQKAYKLTVDGKYGSASKKALEEAVAKKKSSSTTSSTKPVAIVSGGKYIFNGIDYSLVFNPTYYSNKYNDLKTEFGTNATKLFSHFCQYGMREARQAIATFNVTAYKNRYADLRNAFGNDLPSYYKHWIEYGYKEGRSAL